ncbi:putative membrane protein [Streptosporangium album]|uniref:Putative membrane protein n=1 Tax=Streptosporangium album TaxID=47479 RepID=A0A7W7RV63_9ACTN|nr:SRPBCC family protein [Streptosporangium album]MBB4938732.1 putative membrane protein [Streptosporangium album]
MSEHHDHTTDRLARALGWASLGLGTVQLAAPMVVSRLSGVDDSVRARRAVPLTGVRALLHAGALPGGRRPAPWAWSRVVGDAADLTMLRRAAARRRGHRRRRVMAVTAVVAGITAVDLYTAARARRQRLSGTGERGMDLHAAITINRPRQELYLYWRDFENLPRFMAHLESVETRGDGRSHWKARGPAKTAPEWDVAITEDHHGELIVWRSTSGTVGSRGLVSFTDAPGGRGTEVRVNLKYDPPGGKVGAAFAKLLGEHPEQQARDDLRRFKQVVETGEVIRSDGSPEGTRALRQARQRPAQPVKSPQLVK